MNAPAAQQALFNAQWIVLKAGYQSVSQPTPDGSSPLATIWSGSVMQVLYEREDVVDNKVTFRCLATDPKLARNINFTTGRMASQRQVVSQMIEQVPSCVTLNTVPDVLSTNKFERQRTYFGVTDKYFQQITQGNNMQWFKSAHGTYMGTLATDTNEPDITYSPPMPPDGSGGTADTNVTYTLLGTPQQTDSGVVFRVLLDARLIVKIPPMLIKLSNAVIRQMAQSFPTGTTLPLPLDNQYVVSCVRHMGDSRGNQWESEITGVSRAYTQGAVRGFFLTGAS